MQKNFTKIIMTAVFAAMVYVVTVLLPIPIPATGGYVNIGDAVILLAAWTLGGLYAGVAAGIGAGLADLFVAPIYAPGTVVIKFLVAFIAYFLLKKSEKTNVPRRIRFIVSGIVAEIVMIVGYLFYEGVILDLGYAAVAGITGNLLQGGVCIILGYTLAFSLEKTKITKKIFKAI